MARTHVFVLPSGVEMEVRALLGKDQGTITKKDTIGDIDPFNQMLADCIVRLGDKTSASITRKDVENMLINDRKYALVELRQFSLRYKEVFKFNYEWPLDKNGNKEVQAYEAIFTRENFPMTPYIWVREAIEKMSTEDQQALIDNKRYFPVLFESYAEMLQKNAIQTFVTEDGVATIEWEVGSCKHELLFVKADKSIQDINMPIRMRNPQVVLTNVNDKNDKVRTSWNFDNFELYDVEQFRMKMRETEGYIDTFLTIEHQKNPAKTVRVDLVSTVDFFFPSQAI